MGNRTNLGLLLDRAFHIGRDRQAEHGGKLGLGLRIRLRFSLTETEAANIKLLRIIGIGILDPAIG